MLPQPSQYECSVYHFKPETYGISNQYLGRFLKWEGNDFSAGGAKCIRLVNCLQKSIINGVDYANLLRRFLKPQKTDEFNQENAPVHRSLVKMAIVRYCSFEVDNHLP